MFDKVDRILDWYLITLVTLIFLIMTGALIVGPLILGLLVSPYLFFLYIASLFLAPPDIALLLMFIEEVKERN